MLGATIATKNPDVPYFIKAGKFQQAHGGCLINDELDKVQKYIPELMSAFYPSLGDGEHTLDTGLATNIRFKYVTNTINIVNYTNVRADADNKALFTQIGIDAGILARMHIIMQVKCPYKNDDGTLNKERYDHYLGVQSGRIIPERVYDEKFCKDYGLLVKQYFNPPFMKDAMVAFEDMTRKLNQMGLDTQSEVAMRNLEKKPIDPRTMNAVKVISMIIARMLFEDETRPEHAQAAYDLLYLAMYKDLFQIGFGSKEDLIEYISQGETAKVEKKHHLEEAMKIFPANVEIDMTEAVGLVSKALDIEESKADELINLLSIKGDICLVRGHFWTRM
jgi:DNA replicative helicase MCM subunit Mcm2 (Cdc46/Mcm family)